MYVSISCIFSCESELTLIVAILMSDEYRVGRCWISILSVIAWSGFLWVPRKGLLVLKSSVFGEIVGGGEVGEFLQDLEWSVRDLAFWYFCPSILVFNFSGSVMVAFIFLSVVVFSCLALVLFSVYFYFQNQIYLNLVLYFDF